MYRKALIANAEDPEEALQHLSALVGGEEGREIGRRLSDFKRIEMQDDLNVEQIQEFTKPYRPAPVPPVLTIESSFGYFDGNNHVLGVYLKIE